MACQDIKKAVRKSDGFWKSGGGRTNLIYDISTLKMAKDFQV
jgi:hypothetical protein